MVKSSIKLQYKMVEYLNMSDDANSVNNFKMYNVMIHFHFRYKKNEVH